MHRAHVTRSRPLQEESGPLQDLLHSTLPDASQLDAVQACLGHIQILVRQLLGDENAVVVQGSYAQGLALRNSDLDVAVILSRGKSAEKKPDMQTTIRATIDEDAVEHRRAVGCLRRLATALAQADLPEIQIERRIFSAKVPVLRLHCSASAETSMSSRTVVDVSIGNSLLRGACDRCVYSLLKFDNDGTAASLCRLVKLWAKRRRLTNTQRGGFSSFAFVLLTIFFLQQRPKHANRQRLGNRSREPPDVAACLPPHFSVTGPQPKPADPRRGCPDLLGASHCRCSEAELAELLSAFFAWASEELPRLRGSSLSTATAKAEPPVRNRAGNVSKSPVVVQVPFAPSENAARCLRSDVWEGLIVRELARAKRLSNRIERRKQASQKAATVRQLFAMTGGNHDLPEAATAVAEDDSVDEELEMDYIHSPGLTKKRRKMLTKLARKEGASSHSSLNRGLSNLPEVQEGRRKKRRIHATPPDFPEDTSMPATIAPIDRWLSLRSLLDPSMR